MKVPSIASHNKVVESVQPLVLTSSPSRPSFSALYDRWFADVVRWLRALGAPESELEDLTQEVFVVVQRQLDRFDGGKPAAWLYCIAARTASDHRRRSWFKHLFQRRDLPLEELHDERASPSDLLERREAQAVVSALLSGLSEVRRTTFVLFEIEGYSGEEIAAIQDIPVATVWTRLHHARNDFFSALREYHREQAK